FAGNEDAGVEGLFARGRRLAFHGARLRHGEPRLSVLTTQLRYGIVANLPSCTIAFGHTQTAQLFNNSARPADNHTVIIEFLVDDVDKEFERLKTIVIEWVQEPTTMPWGNRSILFRDPDGNLVNLFTPVTEEAIKRLSEP